MCHHHLRPATPADLAEIREIYAYYILHTTVTFEITVPDIHEMLRRFEKVGEANCPYLICEINNEIAGYAYAQPYRPREAYRFTVEDSIYLSPRFQRAGLGSALLNALSLNCQERGFLQMISVVTGEIDSASFKFHQRNGFEFCGTLKKVGYKSDRFLDTHFFQKALK